MKTVEFHLPSSWSVRGTVDEVYEILSEPEDFVRWWPAVYIEVKELAPGNADGVGRVFSLITRGKLPYSLNWQACAIERVRPQRIVVEADGDLQGRGEWRFTQHGEWVKIDYDWTVRVTKRWMRLLSPLLKPVFTANHRWAMREGERGLQRELARRAHAGQSDSVTGGD